MSAEQPAFVSDQPITKINEPQEDATPDAVWPPEIDALFAKRSRLKRIGATQERDLAVPFTLYSKNLSDRFAALFRGNPTSHYVYDPDEEKYSVVKHEIFLSDIIRHLSGDDPSLLSIPIKSDGDVHFGAIDYDRKGENDAPVDHAALARRVTELGLPLIVCQSKGKGAHLYLFVREESGYSAAIVRRLLLRYATLLNLADAHGNVLDSSGKIIMGEGRPLAIEIFPKQESLDTGKVGNGINLPYFGAERIAFGRRVQELSLPQFLDFVEKDCKWLAALLESRDLSNVGGGKAAGAAGAGTQNETPRTSQWLRRVYAGMLADFRAMIRAEDNQNDQLNKCAYFASRASMAGVLTHTEEELQSELRNIAQSTPHCPNIDSTINSGWESGKSQGGFKVKEPPKKASELTDVFETIDWFNENYFIVGDFGGHCRVMWQKPDPHRTFANRLRLSHQSQGEFASQFNNLLIPTINDDGEEELKSVVNLWLSSRSRRQFETVALMPNQKEPNGVYNLWKGFSVDPKQGDCHLYLAHLKNNICNGDEKQFNHLFHTLCYWFQHLDQPGWIALVFKGKKGTGKNKVMKALNHLLGQHALAITQSTHLTGRFNRHLIDCLLLHVNEGFWAGSKKDEGVLKGLVTDDEINIEAKGVDLITVPNQLHIVISSNEDWVVPATVDERRFAFFNVSAAHMQDGEYFAAIDKELENGGYEALLHLLLNTDIRDFDPRRIPAALRPHTQMARSLSGFTAVWYECLLRGELPGGEARKNGEAWVATRDLLDWAREQRRYGWNDISDNQVGLLFYSNPRAKEKDKNTLGYIKTGKPRGWTIPSLVDARAAWDRKQFPGEWEIPVDRRDGEMWEQWEFVLVRRPLAHSDDEKQK